MRVVTVLAGFVAACGPGAGPQDPAHTRTSIASTAVDGRFQRWYPMADSAVPLPAACAARCSLDCDVWSGSIQCEKEGDSIEVWGGLSSMAGMKLNEKGATVKGQETVSDGARLRWGRAADGQFCTTVAWQPSGANATADLYWNWQLCAPDNPSRRGLILAIARGHAPSGPHHRSLECENRGC